MALHVDLVNLHLTCAHFTDYNVPYVQVVTCFVVQNSVAEGYFYLCATSAAGKAGIGFSGGVSVCRCVCLSPHVYLKNYLAEVDISW